MFCKKKKRRRRRSYLKAKTPPVAIYLGKHFPINVFQSKCPIPEARIFNHCKLILPENQMILGLEI
jgi:hypothetical protein